MNAFKIKERLLSVVTVTQTVTDDGPGACRILDQRHSPPAATGPGPFWLHLLQIVTVLEHARAKLVAAVRRHAAQLARDRELCALRDRLCQELSGLILGLRNTCLGLYLIDDPEPLGFPKKIGRAPADLLEQSDRLEEHFGNPDVEMPETRFEKVEIEPTDLVEQVSAKSAELRQAVTAVEAQRQVTEETLRDLSREVAELDGVFSWGARAAESVFALAGERELAARVKPSPTRPGRTHKKPDVSLEALAPELAADLAAVP